MIDYIQNQLISLIPLAKESDVKEKNAAAPESDMNEAAKDEKNAAPESDVNEAAEDEQNAAPESAVTPTLDERASDSGGGEEESSAQSQAVVSSLIESVVETALDETEKEVLQSVQRLVDSVVDAALVELMDNDYSDLVEIKMTTVEDGGHFWAQIESTTTMSYQTLTEDMKEEYGDVPEDETAPEKEIRVGDVYAVAKVSDGAWHRGRVDALTTESCDVFYVDTGVRESTVSRASIRRLSEKLAGVGYLATRCVLRGIEPVGEGNEWAPEAKAFLEEILSVTVAYGRLSSPDGDGTVPIDVFLEADRVKGFQLSSGHLPLVSRLVLPTADGCDTPSEFESIRCEVGSMHEAQEVANLLGASGDVGGGVDLTVNEDETSTEFDRESPPDVANVSATSLGRDDLRFISVGSLMVEKRYAKWKSS